MVDHGLPKGVIYTEQQNYCNIGNSCVVLQISVDTLMLDPWTIVLVDGYDRGPSNDIYID